MSLKIYLWLPRSVIPGHASISLNDGTYLSFRSDADIGKLSELKNDTEIQKRDPDLTFTARGLDEASIYSWWEDFKTVGWPHWITPKNSFSVVVSALRAGGADRKLTKWQRGYYATTVFWTAEKLTYYVTDLESSA